VINLNTPIKFLKGAGDKKAELLKNELGLETIHDILYYFPFRHADRTRFYKLSEISADLPYIQAKGKFTSFRSEGLDRKRRLIGNFSDGTSSIEMVWFSGLKWIEQSYKTGIEYIIYGKPNDFNNRINMVHPEVEEADKKEKGINPALVATYNTTEKLKNSFVTSKAISKIIASALELVKEQLEETLPPYIVNKERLISHPEALFQIHFPESADKLRSAHYRLVLEELLFVELKLLYQKETRKNIIQGYKFTHFGEHIKTFSQLLKFKLTNAQRRVLNQEIWKDLQTGKQMNRLLQGDVGSGKTIVGLITMLLAIDNGYQAALMVPTEILAQQHFKSITRMLGDMPINVRLLTGSSKKKQRTIIDEELKSGELHILIGTHALLEEKVQFKNLGLVVIDEQHRFGVMQRAKLRLKNTLPPHTLVMTATPIPRTLYMTLYGDLDVSVIDELPPGRKPILTRWRSEDKRAIIYKFIRDEIDKGRQAYIVYPLVEESEHFDYKACTDGFEMVKEAFPSPKYQVSMVHGQMKYEEKDANMLDFVSGKSQILVATTVIEVGVDVPNASVMLIENAERFGLAQLHQLRGRVGRGADQSFCILMTPYALSKESRHRLAILEKSTDGYYIANQDLIIRGPGDVNGTLQSGHDIVLKIADLTKDQNILEHARNIAIDILENDPDLKADYNQILRSNLFRLHFKNETEWSKIS